MGTIAKIKCFSCNRKFDYYFNIREKDEIICPYCYTYMDYESVNAVSSVMGSFSEMNSDLKKYASECGHPLFQLDLLEIGE